MVHLYYGDGKGKTTAAVGLAVRAAGRGKRVLLCRFLKNRESGEVTALRSMPNITVMDCGCVNGFVEQMSGCERENTVKEQARAFERVCAALEGGVWDMAVLDEALWLPGLGIIAEERLLKLMRECRGDLELVLTGGEASRELVGAADYVTCMKKVAHPYDSGCGARQGIEF